MEDQTLETIRQGTENIIKTIAWQVLNDLKAEMPKSNSWQWDYAFETIARKYGVEIDK